MDKNELYHFGVKGMKWGVIKKSAYEILTSKKTKDALISAGKNAAIRKTTGVIAQKNEKVKSMLNKDNKLNLRIDKRINKKVKDINSEYSKDKYRQDYLTFQGRDSVKRINNRMNKGLSHEAAYNIEIGQKAVKDVLGSIGLQVVSKVATSYLKDKGIQYSNRNLPRLEKSIIDLDPSKLKVLN